MRVALVLGALVFMVGCLQPLGLPAPEVAIEPAAPDDADDLELVMDDLGDNPGGLGWSIEWSSGGEVQTDLAGAYLVPGSRTANGDEWAVEVALVLGEQTGPPGQATVTIGSGDDDDSGPDDDDIADDDDSGPDDDDITDDDDAVSDPGVGNRLCAAAGVSSNDTYTASACTGPVEAAPGVVTNGTYTIRVNRLAAE